MVVWCTRDLVVLAASYARHPVHDVMWDPYTANEFTSVGQDGSVLFWLLDETGDKMTLNVSLHRCSVTWQWTVTCYLTMLECCES